jgi:outer membrane protein assembly factor BamA
MNTRFRTLSIGRRFLSHMCLVGTVCVSAVGAAGAQQPPVSSAPDDRPAASDDTSLVTPGFFAQAISWAQVRADGRSAPHDGFYAEFGGMIPGSGVSAGVGYRHNLTGTGATVDAAAAISWRRYTTMHTQIAWPQLLDHRLTLGASLQYQDFTQINFFGVGNDSLKNERTDFRLRTAETLGFATIRASSRVSVTGRAGLLTHVGVDPLQEPNLLHADAAVDMDTRDVPGYPARGGRYRVSASMFHDRDLSRYSFRRFEGDAAQYVPLGRTVLTLRGRIDVSQTSAGQEVPFYMLPALGGSNSLRGFLDYRFRDRDLLLIGAEYRWPVLRSLDAAVFYDAGSVAPQISGLTNRFHGDYGVGVRLHSTAHLLARVDVTRSSEGTRALLSFSMPMHIAGRDITPYVP